MNAKEFKESFDLIAYCEKNFDVENRGGSFYICCPFHSESTASMLVLNNRIHCFGCGVHCSSIDFLMSYLELTYQEVLDSDLSEYTGTSVKRKEVVKKVAPLSASMVREFAANLQLNPERKQYLHDRHFTDEAIAKSFIGWGFPKDLFGNKFTCPRYTIPHFSIDRKVVGMRYRIDPRYEKEEIKYLAHPGFCGQIYNIHLLTNHDKLILTGSQLDAAVLWFGCTIPSIATPSENSWNPDWASFFTGKEILIQFDNDTCGLNSSIKVYKALRSVAKKVRIYTWPYEFAQKADTKDFIDIYGIDGIRKILNEL